MEFTYETDLAMAPAEVFERLRLFERIYPAIHAAHEPAPAGVEAPLLTADSRFVLAERFGPEHRRYSFRVSVYDPGRPHLTLAADTETRIGPLCMRSTLEVEFTLLPIPGGTRLLVAQRVAFPNPTLDRLLNRAWLWPSIKAHVEEESRVAVELLTRA